jgi:intergrase/recombinase
LNPRPPACKARQIPVYSEFRERLLKWMSEKKYSVAYQKDAERYLSRYLDNKPILESSGLREVMAECKSNYIYTMVRVYLNFLEENELLSDDDADYFRKVIPSRKTSPDGFIPSDEKVREAYSKIESEPMKTAFSILATSGIRIMELLKMMKEYDRDKLIVNLNIAKYPLNYFRGHKKAFYVYMPKNLALSLKEVEFNDDTISHYFSEIGLAPKYLRKWQYNFLIYRGVPEGVSDFIQGRSSKSVGSMHYLSKVRQADFWYAKIAKELSNRFEIA